MTIAVHAGEPTVGYSGRFQQVSRQLQVPKPLVFRQVFDDIGGKTDISVLLVTGGARFRRLPDTVRVEGATFSIRLLTAKEASKR